MGDAAPPSPPPPPPPSPAPAGSYLDELCLFPEPKVEDVPMRSLPPGWGLTLPHTCSPRNEPAMTGWFMDRFRAFMKDAPRSPSEKVQSPLERWRDGAKEEGYSSAVYYTLGTLVVEVVKDLLERHRAFSTNETMVASQLPNTAHQSPESTTPSTRQISQAPWYTPEDNWFDSAYNTGTIIKAQNNTASPTVATTIIHFRATEAKLYFPLLVEKCRAAAPFAMDDASPLFDVMHLLHLAPYLAAKKECEYLLLTAYNMSLLLHFSFSEDGEVSVSCSDLIQDSSLLPSLLVSVQLSVLHSNQGATIYGTPPWSDPASSIGIYPSPVSVDVSWEVNGQTLNNLNVPEIMIAFCPQGRRIARETYTLYRTEDGKLPKSKKATENKGNVEKKPILLAFAEIGTGTCGTVYMAQYGHHRIAVKTSPVGRDRQNCLVTEYEMYLRLRKAGLEGKVVPRCLGLFMCNAMTVLLTVYSGQACESFRDLPYEDRLAIHRAAKAIEDAGVRQGSFSSRNVVCDDNNVYRIIDFHRGTYEEGRKGDLRTMREHYFCSEKAKYHDGKLPLGRANVVPLPYSDDSDLAESTDTS